MIPGRSRERSGSELVFGLLKTLMVGYQLWGAASSVELAELSGFLHTSESRLGGVLAYLAGEGLVALDESAGTVRLTDTAAKHLLSELEA